MEATEAVELGAGVTVVLERNFLGFSWWVPDLPEWASLVLTALLLLILAGAFPLYVFRSVRRRRSPWAEFLAFVRRGFRLRP